MPSSALLALLLLATDEPTVVLEGLVGVGGGYEDNVTLVTTGQPTTGSAVGSAWAALGAGWLPGETTYLSAAARYDGAYYAGASDLTRNAAGADLLWIQELGDVVAVVVAGGGTYSWYADAARSGPALYGRAALRVRPLDWLTVRAGYGYGQRWAEADVYSGNSNRVFGGAEARVAKGVYLGLGYAWTTGEQTFYRTATGAAVLATARAGLAEGAGVGAPVDPGAGSGTATGPGSGSGSGTGSGTGSGGGAGGGGAGGGTAPQGSGVFADLVPYRALATDSTLTPTFEATVWEGLYLFASYSYTWGSSSEGSYTAQSGIGGVGYRF